MIAIIAITIVVGIIWGSVLLRWTGLLGGCLTVLLAGCIFGHPFFHLDVGGIPITTDRILLSMLVGVFVILWRLGRLASRQLDRQDIVMCGFTLVLILSVATRGRDAHGLATLLIFYLMPLVVYWMMRSTPIQSGGIWGLFAVLAVFGFYLAVTSVLEQQQITTLVFPRFIVSAEFPEFLGRGRGPLLNPAANGFFLAAGLVCTLLFWPRANRLGRALIGLASVIFVAGIACTLTRSVWAAAALAFVILLFGTLPRRQSVAIALLLCVVGTGLVASKWSDLRAFKRDQNVSVSDMAQSARLRPILAVIAWNMFLDRPLAGCGFGRYANESINYLSDRSTPLPLEKARDYVQHNVVLSLLTETGIAGAGLFLLMFGFWYASAWQLSTDPGHGFAARQLGVLIIAVLSVYLVIGMFQDLTIVRMANFLLYFVLGVGRSITGQRRAGVATAVTVQNNVRRSRPNDPVPGIACAGPSNRLPFSAQ